MFSLESPHRGDSYENTQYTVFNIKKKITLNYSKSEAMGFFPKGLNNEIETTVVNEPSMFEPLKFYCTWNKQSLCTSDRVCSNIGKKVQYQVGRGCCKAICHVYGAQAPCKVME